MLFRLKSARGAFEYLVVGLGNPGPRYAATRHNAGFMAVEYIRQKTGASREKLRFKALCSEAEISGKRALLLRPQTFMNNSGESVREAAQFYKVPMERVIVLYDDITLEPGRLRIRERGSDGGHNGVKSIIYQCRTEQFPRVRIGIGESPHPEYDLADWVLTPFPDSQKQSVFDALCRAHEAVCLIVAGRAEEAMNLYNRA